MTTGHTMGGLPDLAAYWDDADVHPAPGPQGAAIDLLAASVDAGATLVAIGPYTNLGLLEAARPGILGRARVVLMGGWIAAPRDGLPPWGRRWTGTCSATPTPPRRSSARPATSR